MKQLKCEVCGSTDLIKDGGVFVCQSCGMKYSLEEVRKLTVEGTVKVDNTDRVKNLYITARKARDINDFERAANYYDMILQEEPDSWEANFYSVYCNAASCKIAQIKSSSQLVASNFPVVLSLINKNVPEKEQTSIVNEVAKCVNNLYINWGKASYNFYLPYEDLASCAADLSQCAADAMKCGDAVVAEFASNRRIAKKAIPLYETAMSICSATLDLRPSTLDPYVIMGQERAQYNQFYNLCNEKREKLKDTNSSETGSINNSNTKNNDKTNQKEAQDSVPDEKIDLKGSAEGCMAFVGMASFVVFIILVIVLIFTGLD